MKCDNPTKQIDFFLACNSSRLEILTTYELCSATTQVLGLRFSALQHEELKSQMYFSSALV